MRSKQDQRRERKARGCDLGRIGLDHVDLIYATPLPEGLEVSQAVHDIGDLITSGKARVWGVAMWPADLIAEAARIARAEGIPTPCAVQLAYNVVERSPVEDRSFVEALDAAGARVVASATLAYGALTGKYATAGATGRLAPELDDPHLHAALRAAEPLRLLAGSLGTTPATLAIAFVLANPHVASALFGATRPEQVAENVEAVGLLERMDDSELAELRRVGQ